MPTFDDGPWVPPTCRGSHHAGCHCREARHRHDLSCERRAKERAQAQLAEALAAIDRVRQACAVRDGADPHFWGVERNRLRAKIAALLPPKGEP